LLYDKQQNQSQNSQHKRHKDVGIYQTIGPLVYLVYWLTGNQLKEADKEMQIN